MHVTTDFNVNFPFFGFKSNTRVLPLLLFPSLIFYCEILQQLNQTDDSHFYFLVVHCKYVKIQSYKDSLIGKSSFCLEWLA